MYLELFYVSYSEKKAQPFLIDHLGRVKVLAVVGQRQYFHFSFIFL